MTSGLGVVESKYRATFPQGAGNGAAAQAIAPGDAYLRVGGDARPLALAVDWVRAE